jgi:hypothetical protein
VIARHGGEERVHSRWRPVARVATLQGSQEPARAQPAVTPANPPRRGWMLLGIVGLVVAAAVAGHQHGGRATGASSLPAAPQQWVADWTAASLSNPGRVCRRLFAPALATAFKADTGRSCIAYYRNVRTTSFRVRRVIVDGNAAAVEARQVGAAHGWGYFTVLLSRVSGGWQAIDIVPGGSVRPRGVPASSDSFVRSRPRPTTGATWAGTPAARMTMRVRIWTRRSAHLQPSAGPLRSEPEQHRGVPWTTAPTLTAAQ